MPQVDFVFFDAGGGHRAAATALKSILEQRHPGWAVRLVNLQEIFDDYDFFQKLFGIRGQDIYNLLLKKGWTLGSPQMTVVMHWMIRMTHGKQVRVLKEFWAKTKPDLVVSVIPNFGRALYQSLKAVHPRTPLATILTDIADYPPQFWIEPGQDQHYVCGSAKAVEQARSMGYGAERVHPVSGMILNPRFYQPVEKQRSAERVRLGLEADRPTGLILFGGQGSKLIRSILERLQGGAGQYIVICGKNQKLRDELSARQWKMPVFVEGYTSEIPYYMHLSDFFIGKPGPGSVSEAIAMKLPVIVESNAWTLPQERYNAEWIRENEVGMVLRNFTGIGDAVAKLLAGDTLEHYKRNAARLENRAVFEIPPILEAILESR